MGVFEKEIKLIQGLPSVIDKTIKETVSKYGFVIKNYNIIKQLDEKGEDSDGDKLQPAYSNPYKRIRIKRGLQVAYVDTHFTGKFHASLEIIVEDGQFRITSNVDYAKHVIKRYGEKTLGIQQRYLNDFVNKYLLEELQKSINGYFTKS